MEDSIECPELEEEEIIYSSMSKPISHDVSKNLMEAMSGKMDLKEAISNIVSSPEVKESFSQISGSSFGFPGNMMDMLSSMGLGNNKENKESINIKTNIRFYHNEPSKDEFEDEEDFEELNELLKEKENDLDNSIIVDNVVSCRDNIVELHERLNYKSLVKDKDTKLIVQEFIKDETYLDLFLKNKNYEVYIMLANLYNLRIRYLNLTAKVENNDSLKEEKHLVILEKLINILYNSQE
jgi:hypothetical protein